MSHWGITTAKGGGQLWNALSQGKPDNTWRSPMDKLEDRAQRDTVNAKKWNTPANPIPAEDQKEKPEAPEHYRRKIRAKVFEHLRRQAMKIPDRNLQLAELQSIAAAEKIYLDKEINTRIDAEVLQNFRDWVLGRGYVS